MSDDPRVATLQRAFAAASAGDVEAQLAEYCDDVVLEVVFADPPLRCSGRDEFRRLLTMAYGANELRISIDDVVECADPEQLVVEMSASGTALASGATFTKQYIVRFWFRDGAIARQREFAVTR